MTEPIKMGSEDQKSEEAFADLIFADEKAAMDKTGYFEFPVKKEE